MASEKLAIHVRPGSTPQTIIRLTDAMIQSGSRFASVKELLDFSNSLGLGTYSEIKTSLVEFGFIDETKDGIILSDGGQDFTRISSDAQADVLHVLMYIGWSETAPLNFLPSWAYRRCCDTYWDAGGFEITSAFLDHLVEGTTSAARETFSNTGAAVDEVSFSRDSVRGIHKWLEPLNPPVLIEKRFKRRNFCPPAALSLALGWVIRDLRAIEDSDILLTPQKQEALCRICLLEPIALNRALDWAVVSYPNLYSQAARSGVFGRTIRLKHRPTLQDFIA